MVSNKIIMAGIIIILLVMVILSHIFGPSSTNKIVGFWIFEDALNADNYQEEMGMGFFGTTRSSGYTPEVDGWQAVESWEIEKCRKWGGSASGAVNKGSTSKTPISLSQLTITIQAEKAEYNIENQSALYKVSWYMEPVSDELDYKVWLVGDGNMQIGSGTAKNTAPGIGYYAEYINKDFTHAKIEYPGNYLQVPIVS